MRVGFSDPQGHKVWRLLPYLAPALALLFAMFGPLSGTPAAVTALVGLALFNAIGLFDLRQRAPRTAELECGPGYVDVKKAGSRNQRIKAKDITGGTTARTSTGLLLTLQHRKRDQPITLEVANDAEAHKIRHALGIGHGGFGVVAWRTHGNGTTRAAIGGRIVALVSALALIFSALSESRDIGFAIGTFAVLFGFVGGVIGLGSLFAQPTEPSVVMGADGLRLKTPRGWFALPYEGVQRVEAHPNALFLAVPEPYRSVFVEWVGTLLGGPSQADRRVIVSQVNAAAQRARGFGPQKQDVTGRVDVLRRHGESPRDWLVRLDMAGQMLSAGPGYRGNTLDVEDLWAILEDPEAEPELRAAAARVLRHSPAPDARVRIDAAVAAVRDEATNRRLRIAVKDDLDGASQELAYLDATDPRSSARMHAAAPRSTYGR